MDRGSYIALAHSLWLRVIIYFTLLLALKVFLSINSFCLLFFREKLQVHFTYIPSALIFLCDVTSPCEPISPAGAVCSVSKVWVDVKNRSRLRWLCLSRIVHGNDLCIHGKAASQNTQAKAWGALMDMCVGGIESAASWRLAAGFKQVPSVTASCVRMLQLVPSADIFCVDKQLNETAGIVEMMNFNRWTESANS